MHPFGAASFLPATPAEESFDARQQEEEPVGAASSPSPSPSRGTRAGVENAGIRCQDCGHRAKAYCAHCCSDRDFLCPGHVKTPHVPASQCSERQPRLAASASASTAAVDVEPISKRPHRPPLPSVAAHTTTSSVDQPIVTTMALGRFAREVSLDAVFRRVRLGGPEPDVAYYTTITIAGHVFRGVLYDVGPHSGSTAASDTDGSGEEVGSSASLSTAGGSCLDLTLGM